MDGADRRADRWSARPGRRRTSPIWTTPAEAELAALQRVVTEVRRFRADQGLKPGQRVAARLERPDRRGLATHEPLIRSLVRLDEPGDGLRRHRDAGARRRGRGRAGHPRRDRRRRRAGPAGEGPGRGARRRLAQCQAKLGNPAFTDKAPASRGGKDPGKRLAAVAADLDRIAAALRRTLYADEPTTVAIERRRTPQVEAGAGRRAATPGWCSTWTRIEALLDLLGSPQRAYPAIHLTGTNGKTSTARMIDALLRAHGLRTGRYTSPHLDDGPRADQHRRRADRARSGSSRSTARSRRVAEFLDQRGAATAESLTYFDLTTAMALAAFADAPVDVAVVEVGLGGADDATNVLQALHLRASPRSGSTTPSGSARRSRRSPPPRPASSTVERRWSAPRSRRRRCAPILERCAEVGATARCWRGRRVRGTRPRAGRRRAACSALQGLGGVYDGPVPAAARRASGRRTPRSPWPRSRRSSAPATSPVRQLDPRAGAARASPRRQLAGPAGAGPQPRRRSCSTPRTTRTAWPPRWPHCAEEFAFSRLVAVVAVLADKDAAGMLELLEPVADAVVCTRNSSPRAMPVAELAKAAGDVFGPDRVRTAPQVEDAVELALTVAGDLSTGDKGAAAKTRSMVLVTGSVTTVAQARRMLVA